MLSNADFPSMPKLTLNFPQCFSDKHISNKNGVTSFSNTVLPAAMKFDPENKPVYQLLRYTSCQSELVLDKIQTFDHVLCKSFLTHDPIVVASPADAVNVIAKFAPLHSRVYVLKSLFRPLHVLV